MPNDMWQSANLGSLAQIRTGKLDSNAALPGGPYPFFTCSPETLAIDLHAFDCEAVLLAGNNANGVFCVKYYKGKFNAYQRTYVITARDPNMLDTRYLYYQLKLLGGGFGALSIGSATKFLTMRILEPMQVPLPPLSEQRSIACVLGVLDDKIEQNRRTGRALERLARATFKAWFVDFEPVKAKAAGQTSFPGMPPAAFAALPDRLTDSPLGPVPQGWEVKPLSHTVKLTMGQSPKSEFYNEEGRGLPFHQGVTDYGFRFPSDRVYCTAEGRIAEPGDILLSVRAPVGRINVTDRRLILGRGLAGMRHIDDQQSFLLYQMFHVFAEEDAIGDGTIYKAVNKDFLVMMPLIAPPKAIRDSFEAIVRPMDQLILASEKESVKLAALRDYLLPRLLSGRVRVREAAQAAEGAGV